MSSRNRRTPAASAPAGTARNTRSSAKKSQDREDTPAMSDDRKHDGDGTLAQVKEEDAHEKEEENDQLDEDHKHDDDESAPPAHEGTDVQATGDDSLVAVEEQAIFEVVQVTNGATDAARPLSASKPAPAPASSASDAKPAIDETLGVPIEPFTDVSTTQGLPATPNDATAHGAATAAANAGIKRSWTAEYWRASDHDARTTIVANLELYGAPQDLLFQLEDDDDEWINVSSTAGEKWARLYRAHQALNPLDLDIASDVNRVEVKTLLAECNSDAVTYLTAARTCAIARALAPPPTTFYASLLRHALLGSYDPASYNATDDIRPDVEACLRMVQTLYRRIDLFQKRRAKDPDHIPDYPPKPTRTPIKGDFVALYVAMNILIGGDIIPMPAFAAGWDLEFELHAGRKVDGDIAVDVMTRAMEVMKWLRLDESELSLPDELDFSVCDLRTAWNAFIYAKVVVPGAKDAYDRNINANDGLNAMLEIGLTRPTAHRSVELAGRLATVWERADAYFDADAAVEKERERERAGAEAKKALADEVDERSSPSDIAGPGFVSHEQQLIKSSPRRTSTPQKGRGRDQGSDRGGMTDAEVELQMTLEAGVNGDGDDDAEDNIDERENALLRALAAEVNGVYDGMDDMDMQDDAVAGELAGTDGDHRDVDMDEADVDQLILKAVDDSAPDVASDVEVGDAHMLTLPPGYKNARPQRTEYINANGIRYRRVMEESAPLPQTLEERFQEIKDLMKEDWTGVDRMHPRVIRVLTKVNDFVAVLADVLGDILSIGPLVGNSISHRLGVNKPDVTPKPYNIFTRFLTNSSNKCAARREWDDLFARKDKYSNDEISAYFKIFKSHFEHEPEWKAYLTAYDLEHAAGSEPTVDSWHKAFEAGVKTVDDLFRYLETSRGTQAICLMASDQPHIKFNGRDTALVATSGVRHFFDSKTHLTQDEIQVLFGTEAKYGAGSDFVRLRLEQLGLQPADQPVHSAKEVTGALAAIRASGLPGKDAAEAAIAFNTQWGGLPLDEQLPPAPDGFINVPTWTGTPYRSALINIQLPVRDDFAPRGTTSVPSALPNNFSPAYCIEFLKPVFKVAGYKWPKQKAKKGVDNKPRFPSADTYQHLLEKKMAFLGGDWYMGFWYAEGRGGKPDGLNTSSRLAMASILKHHGEFQILKSYRLPDPQKLFERFPDINVARDAVVWPLFISTLIPPNAPGIPAVFWNTARVVLKVDGADKEVVLGIPYDTLTEWFKARRWKYHPTVTYRRLYNPDAPPDYNEQQSSKAAVKAKPSSRAVVASDDDTSSDDDVAARKRKGKAARKSARADTPDDRTSVPLDDVLLDVVPPKKQTKAKRKSTRADTPDGHTAEEADEMEVYPPVQRSAKNDKTTSSKKRKTRARTLESDGSSSDVVKPPAKRTRTSTGVLKVKPIKVDVHDDSGDDDFEVDEDEAPERRMRSVSRQPPRPSKQSTLASDDEGGTEGDAERDAEAFDAMFNRNKPRVPSTPKRPTTTTGRAESWLERHAPLLDWLKKSIDNAEKYKIGKKELKELKEEYASKSAIAERHEATLLESKKKQEVKNKLASAKAKSSASAASASTSGPAPVKVKTSANVASASTSRQASHSTRDKSQAKEVDPPAPPSAAAAGLMVELGTKDGLPVLVPQAKLTPYLRASLNIAIYRRSQNATIKPAIGGLILTFIEQNKKDGLHSQNLATLAKYIRANISDKD